MPERIQLLIVEDNSRDAELIVSELKRSQLEFDWHRVDTEEEYLAR